MSGSNGKMNGMPHDEHAEAALLGAMIADNRIVPELAAKVRPEHFYRGSHRLTYAAALALADRGSTIGFITLRDELTRTGHFENVGGADGLTSINRSGGSSAAAWPNHAQIVLEKAKLRALLDFARKVARDAEEAKCLDDADEILNFVEAQLLAIRTFNASGRPHRTFSDLVSAAFVRINEYAAKKGVVDGVTTGLRDLDNLIGGFRASQLAIIAGRPAMGKSTLANNVALHAALNEGKSVAIFSYENDPEQVTMNFISSLTPADSYKMAHGTLPAATWADFPATGDRLYPLKFEIPHAVGFDTFKIRSHCRLCKSRPSGLDLVVVDYLGLVTPPRDAGENRQQQVAAMSRALKELALELKIPVIALSQLNRSPDSRSDNKPSLSDLRESGAIEQDADIVLLLYREEYYKPDTPNKGIAEVHVAKHRNGPTGIVRLAWQAEYLRFVNLAKPYQQEGRDDNG